MNSALTPTAHPAPPPLTPAQLATLRDQLEEQRRFRLEQVEHLRAGRAADAVTEILLTGARAALRDVVAALRRMDTATYGWCTDCAAALPLERLEVIPQVAQCLSCRATNASTAL